MILGDDGKPPVRELEHVGVKGMKWGHRKAQPPTISRTGERRYATNAKSANRRKTAMKVGGAALALGGAAAAAYLLKGSVGSTTVSAATSAVARSRPLEHDFAHLLSTPLSQANVQSLYDIARSG